MKQFAKKFGTTDGNAQKVFTKANTDLETAARGLSEQVGRTQAVIDAVCRTPLDNTNLHGGITL